MTILAIKEALIGKLFRRAPGTTDYLLTRQISVGELK